MNTSSELLEQLQNGQTAFVTAWEQLSSTLRSVSERLDTTALLLAVQAAKHVHDELLAALLGVPTTIALQSTPRPTHSSTPTDKTW